MFLTPKHKHTLAECINYRLGPEILEKTKINTSTQKVESGNQIIRRYLPKSLTFSRCFPGRTHGAVFSANNGPDESLVKRCEEAGCPISRNSRVSAALLTKKVESEKRKEGANSIKRKLTRKRKRENNTRFMKNIKRKPATRKAYSLSKAASLVSYALKRKAV